ncbi:heterokaryon incompatibility protein-domain-containing protein [Podospora didyma]|uniref:Heterokaryon incompatibility protein-domain-containing protein n=1 Tax=Podospora didyma TaxID=330526 RepID=A0AAE0K5S3_9PEZI|nr:heterokaryon incompatibility protein-domain-containing protein [Podospora didyma]
MLWKISVPIPQRRAIRDRLARRAEVRAPKKQDLAPFQYSQLHGPGKIRLLKIDRPKSAWRPGLIRCTMDEFPLTNTPSYRALSYTWKEKESIQDFARDGHHWSNPFLQLYSSKRWKALIGTPNGPPGSRRPWLDNAVKSAALAVMRLTHKDTPPRRLIICNGCAMFVTHNLHNALTVLSRRHPGHWWIDQLCINQEDVQERSSQVALMGQLYRTASDVVVWLGESTRMESQAVPALKMMANLGNDVKDIMVASTSLFGREVPKLFALVGFFSRSWFDRVWIVQEFAVAKDAIFLLGDTEIPLDLVARALARIEQILSASTFGSVLGNTDIPLSTRSKLLDCRAFTISNREWSLEKWLGVARARETTDHRDLVFGGLSLLARHADQPVPEVVNEPLFLTRTDTTALGADYSKSVQAVYHAFSVALLSSDLGINALSLVGTRRDLAQFPSWVINLHYPGLPTPFHQLQVRQPRMPHRPSCAAEMCITGEIALTEGVRFDKVRDVGEPLGHWFSGQGQGDSPFHLTETFRIFLELGPRYDVTGELILVALWRTLILESDGRGLPNLDASFADALRWYLDMHRLDTRKMNPQTDEQKGVFQSQMAKHNDTRTRFHSMVSMPEYHSTVFSKSLLAHTPLDGMKSKTGHERNMNDLAIWHETFLAFLEAFHEAAPGRRVFITHGGYLGIGPATAQPGDEVMFLRGAWAPYITRTVDLTQQSWWVPAKTGPEDEEMPRILIGEGYVHGIMDHLGNDESMLAAAGSNAFSSIWFI